MSIRSRLATVARVLQRFGYALLVAAAMMALVGGIVLATGHPRAHTLIIYFAVALATFGVVFTLPFALRNNPLAPEDDQ